MITAVLALLGAQRPAQVASSRRPTILSNVEGRLWRELAVQDWVVAIYLLVLLGFTLAGSGPRRGTALTYLSIDLALFAVGVVLHRGGILSGGRGALAYRLGVFAGLFGSFACLQYVLPTARSVTVDADLVALDMTVFGVEPALAFDRFVTPATTEWFSFFYFGYFVLLALFVFPFLFAAKNMKRLSEIALGIVLIFSVGHVLYMIVPGHGPYIHLSDRFTHTLDGPLWWRLVKTTVDSVDITSRTDIFPSLHTAAPTYLALFSFRHRREPLFRFVWLPTALFASQIVISTMFLRWHYLIDVCAGLALASIVSVVAHRVSTREHEDRAMTNREPVWTTFL